MAVMEDAFSTEAMSARDLRQNPELQISALTAERDELLKTQYPLGWRNSVYVHFSDDTFGAMLEMNVSDIGHSDKQVVFDSPELEAQIKRIEQENAELRQRVQEISLDWQTVQSENEELKAELAQYKLPHDEWQKVRRETELVTAERRAEIVALKEVEHFNAVGLPYVMKPNTPYR